MTGGDPEATGTPRTEEAAGDPDNVPSADGLAEAATDPTNPTDPKLDRATRFAHASEAEMARILDFYQVRWEYEPTTFPILWNLDGEVVESFAPDFYLPELEVFLEMTTLKQRLVRKKNRKLRRLRELYPDIRIKLFYARDFRAMMLKYGRLGLAESLSGTTGQVVPVKTPLSPVAAEVAAAADIPAPAPEAVAPDVAAPRPDPGAAPGVAGASSAPDAALAPAVARATRTRTRAGRRRRRAAQHITTAGAEKESGA